MPFAKVHFKDSKIGTVADVEGFYRIETYYATDSLIASVVGYKDTAIAIIKDKSQKVDFHLSETVQGLKTHVVQASKRDKTEDPAWGIWRSVQANKGINNREKLRSYQYEVYNKIEFDLNNLTEKFTKRKVFKNFDFIFDNVDSSGNKPYLPMFMTESLSDFYFRKDPKSEKEFIKATRISGVKNESVSQFMGDMYQNVNIYDSRISVFGKTFISPLSGTAKLYYNMYLLDSAFIDNYWCYKIRFMPKRKQEPTFVGDMWVHDTTFAIKRVNAEIAEDANINFVNYLEVKQEYEQVEDEIWMLVKDELFVDLYLTDNTMGFYGRKSTSYADFVINQPKADEFYSGGQNIYIADDVGDKSDAFWESARHDTLSKNERIIFEMMDTLEQIPTVQSYIDIVTILLTGYKELGKIEIGPFTKFYSFNQIEGHRFGFGGRTSNNFSTRIEFSGNVAYGLKDEQWKYGGGFRYMVSKTPRQVLSASYSYDMEQLGQGQNAFSEDNVLASLLRRNPNNKLTYVTDIKGSYNHEWFPGFNSELKLRWRDMVPAPGLEYLKYNPEGAAEIISNITASEISFYTRFAYDEKFVSGEFDRISLGTRYPVLELQYSYGIPDLFGADYEYNKALVRIKHWFPVGILGWTKYTIEAGKYWGTLPYPLLELHDGNETYFYQNATFNTMNFFEFVSDSYVTLFLTHHFDGFFFNRVPLFRKLKWREVVSFNAAIGQFDDKHLSAMALLPNMYTLEQPFMEVAVGVENIFKILRVDFIKRLNYLDHPNIVNWGIRAMFDVDF